MFGILGDMKKTRSIFIVYSLIVTLFVLMLRVQTVSAHEVYVLPQQQISYDISHPSPNPLTLIVTERNQFLAATLAGIILVVGVFLLSISKFFEQKLDPILLRIKRYAPLVARLTLGLSLIAAGYYGALFGPELPLTAIAPGWAPLLQLVLFIIGTCIMLGFFVRESAVVALIIFCIAVVMYKSYMLTYVNYLGEIVANLILGAGAWSLDAWRKNTGIGTAFRERFEPYAFPVLRVLFGISALYASWYAKLFHSNLALNTVTDYHLTKYFHFSALFIVLGALIVESLIGFFFILGIEIRFTALFFLVFLTLSLFFFGEVVWPHLILIGVNIAFILHGYDKYSIEGRFFEKDNREPVL
jgi:uncharacterized membrane protein YphA (DoxX/SURF4 family)